ncbi:hypothetical protein [Enterococcus phage VEsP-2]|jgi:hypothetical protein|nr:hypothetical protein [Enterococcus phage VEsP-2]
MTLKIKCTYVAEGEPFTLGKGYDIYFSDGGGLVYIKNDVGRKVGEFKGGYATPIDALLEALKEGYYSHFTVSNLTIEDTEPEKDIKKEVHELLDKATELIYNNQEELKIDYMDFITLVKIKDEVKK